MSDLFLIHGLFFSKDASLPGGTSRACAARSRAVADYSHTLGVQSYECIASNKRKMANRLLRLMRGTACPVDALEVMTLDINVAATSLTESRTRELWRTTLGCQPYGFDPERSFLLMGELRELVRGASTGHRVLWFGRGLPHLSEAEFVAHYTGQHGPLVAKYAQSLGICRYRQVASEDGATRDSLCELGLGQAPPPSVFAELVLTMPPINLASPGSARLASREIKADEKRHIDFRRSMLLLA
jgi:hypothetical protein